MTYKMVADVYDGGCCGQPEYVVYFVLYPPQLSSTRSLHKKRRSLNPRNMGKQENRKNNSLRVEVNMMESFKFLALLMGLFLAFHKNVVDSQQGNIYRRLSRYKQLGG